MVGFGELRRLSLLWQVDIAEVERSYALDWLLKGIFDLSSLGGALVVRGATALGKVYFSEYPLTEEADFLLQKPFNISELEGELSQAARSAALGSGLVFKLHSIRQTEARFEFTGPLGRRSAAQPHLPISFRTGPLYAAPVYGPLLHPFADKCEATVRAVSLEEIAATAAERIPAKPRALDVFELWFILERGGPRLDRLKLRALMDRIAVEKGHPLAVGFDASYRPFLERAWDNALKRIPAKPTFKHAEKVMMEQMGEILLRNS